jgi:hypothetical protein
MPPKRGRAAHCMHRRSSMNVGTPHFSQTLMLRIY